jgi:sec-independent protein translocase protein TatC
MALAVVLGAVVAFAFRSRLFELIVAPYERVAEDRSLVFFKPTEAFAIFMRLSLFGGLVIASPVVIYQVWRFISPALTRRESRIAVPVVTVLAVLFVGGVLFGYLMLEPAMRFLLEFGGDALEPVIGGNEYLTFALRLLLVFGLAFEFPVFVYLAAATGVVGWRRLAAARRGVIMILLIVSALVTPGDPFTMIALAAPLYLLYEATIWLVRFTIRR